MHCSILDIATSFSLRGNISCFLWGWTWRCSSSPSPQNSEDVVTGWPLPIRKDRALGRAASKPLVMLSYFHTLALSAPDFLPSWYVALRELYSSFTLPISPAQCFRSSSSGISSNRSTRLLAVKNLFFRL